MKYGLLSIKYEDSEDNDARDYANKCFQAIFREQLDCTKNVNFPER